MGLQDSDLQMVQDDAGAEEVVIDANEVRELRVQNHPDAFLSQSQSLFLWTRLVILFKIKVNIYLHLHIETSG